MHDLLEIFSGSTDPGADDRVPKLSFHKQEMVSPRCFQ